MSLNPALTSASEKCLHNSSFLKNCPDFESKIKVSASYAQKLNGGFHCSAFYIPMLTLQLNPTQILLVKCILTLLAKSDRLSASMQNSPTASSLSLSLSFIAVLSLLG